MYPPALTYSGFPTHCTYETGGAQAPTPPACKFSITARADGQSFTVRVPTALFLRYQNDHFFPHGGHDKLQGQGGMCRSESSTFSLSQPRQRTQQSTAASAAHVCFRSQRNTLILSLTARAWRVVQRSCRDR